MSEETTDKVATEETEIPQVEKPVGEESASNEEIEKELEQAAAEEQVEETPEDEVNKWREKAIRAIADLENYRKRMAREKADSIRFGNQKLLMELLPVIDSFNMGMMAAEQDADSMIYMGMKMVQTQLENFLTDQGVKAIELKPGDKFDPNQQDAMSQEESEEIAEGCIIRVMRKGFMMGDRLLRPATVVVSGKEEKAEEASEGAESEKATEVSEEKA